MYFFTVQKYKRVNNNTNIYIHGTVYSIVVNCMKMVCVYIYALFLKLVAYYIIIIVIVTAANLLYTLQYCLKGVLLICVYVWCTRQFFYIIIIINLKWVEHIQIEVNMQNAVNGGCKINICICIYNILINVWC